MQRPGTEEKCDQFADLKVRNMNGSMKGTSRMRAGQCHRVPHAWQSPHTQQLLTKNEWAQIVRNKKIDNVCGWKVVWEQL